MSKLLCCLVLAVFCWALSPEVSAQQTHPDGLFVGLEQFGKQPPKPDENGYVWYNENVLTIRGDSLFLRKTLVCYKNDTKYAVASSATTMSAYAGRIAEDGTLLLKIVQCETCGVELQQNPETGVYEEVPDRGKTVAIRFEQDMVHLDGIVYMKKG